MINKNINYSLISQAIDFYIEYDYKYIEVPWLVSLDAIQSTFVGDAAQFSYKDNNYKTNISYPVASAEQSFVQMLLDNKLAEDGKYVAVTPCFRPTENDETHNPYFMKVELIHILDNKSDSNIKLENVICEAKSFFRMTTHKNAKEVKTNIGTDLYMEDIELGSYGIRNYKHLSWIYGTGLAEPRLSMVLNKLKGF